MVDIVRKTALTVKRTFLVLYAVTLLYTLAGVVINAAEEKCRTEAYYTGNTFGVGLADGIYRLADGISGLLFPRDGGSGHTVVPRPCMLIPRLGLAALQALITYGYMRFCLGLVRGGRGRLTDLMAGFKSPWRLWLLSLIMFVLEVIGLLLFVLPALIIAMTYSKALMLMMDDPTVTATEALGLSRELMRGEYGTMGRVLLLLLALCLLMIWLAAQFLSFLPIYIIAPLIFFTVVPLFACAQCHHYCECTGRYKEE